MSRFRRGTVTREIALNPVEFTNAENEEIFIPYQMELKNVYLTDLGNLRKRPGYAEAWDTTSVWPIIGLIPQSTGYAIDSDGVIYKLSGSLSTAVQLINVPVEGGYRPQYVNHNDLLILTAGGYPVKIENGTSSLLGGSPPRGVRFMARISTYTILAGYDDTEFRWCTTGNPESWPAANVANIQKVGETIKHMLARREYLYFFKENSIEVWVNIGRSGAVFARRDEMWVDGGVGDAGYSPVVADDNIYYFDAEDRSFNIIDGRTPVVISRSHRKDLEALTVTSDCYGFDCRKENSIRWFFPTNGKCFKYDYKNKIFSQDNRWVGSGWQRFPMYSYMEMGGSAYFGDYEPTGLVFELSKDNQDDNGQPIRVLREFYVQPSEKGNSFITHRLGFRLKRGVGDAGTSPVFSYRYNWDRGAWSTWTDLDLEVQGNDDPWIWQYGLGQGREQGFQIACTADYDFLLTNMKLTMEELNN
jgi:hypothetical protein